jgi:hypothetical protein
MAAYGFGLPDQNQIAEVLNCVADDLETLEKSGSVTEHNAESIRGLVTLCRTLRVKPAVKITGCTVCGADHDLKTYEISFARPDAWLDIPALESKNHCKGTEDICSIDMKLFYVRGTLPFNIVEQGVEYRIGIWAQVDAAWQARYADSYFLFLAGKKSAKAVPVHKAILANQLPFYPQTLNAEILVIPDPSGARPTFQLTDEAKDLTRYQKQGMPSAVFSTIFSEHIHAMGLP